MFSTPVLFRRPLLGLFVPFFACAGPLPQLSTESDLLRATGTSSLLQFRWEGGPLDVPTTSDPAAASRLSLRDAVERCLVHAPELQEGLSQVEVALAAAEQARTFSNPVISVVWRFGQGPTAFEAGLTESIVDLLQTRRRASAADHRLEGAVSAALTIAIDLLAEVQERYAEAQAADLALPLLRERAAGLDRLLGLADSRLRAGEGSALERATVAVQRFDLDRAIEAATRAGRQTRVLLSHRLGEPSGAAEWALDAWSPPSAVAGPESAWIAAALASRPELRAQQFLLAALGDDEALASWAPWQGATIGAETQRTPVWFTGPNATVPLPVFDTGAAASHRARAEVAAARHRLTEIARGVVAEVRVAHGELQGRCAELQRVRGEQLPAQQRLVALATSAQRRGQQDAGSVLFAEQVLAVAQLAALELERDAQIARIRLRRAVGGVAAEASATADTSMAVASEERQ